MNNFDVNNVEKVCRACLSEENEMMSMMDSELKEMFIFCTSLEFDIDDKLPKSICSKCKNELISAHMFKNVCIKSNNVLRQHLSSSYEIDDLDLNLNDLFKIDFTDNNCDDPKTNSPEEILKEEDTTKKKKRKLNKNFTFHCEICSEGFNLEEDLALHAIAHPNDGVPKCTICNKVFSSLKVLKRHIRIHLKSKPFACNICSKTFSESGSLTRHLRKHRGEKRHLCTVCGKGFYEANVLVVHMRTHTGEKPIKCEVCGKRFSDPNGLRSHIKSHTGEKKYICKICNKCFSHSFVLKKHFRIHSGERPYLCTVCGKSFTQVYSELILFYFSTSCMHFRVIMCLFI
jgi:hypothetical protein